MKAAGMIEINQKKRSAEWQKKYLMEQVSEEEFNKIIESGKPLMLIVPKGEIKHFRQSSIYPHVSESSEAGTSEVYVLNKKDSIQIIVKT